MRHPRRLSLVRAFLASLVLGAFTSVGVAWALAWSSPIWPGSLTWSPRPILHGEASRRRPPTSADEFTYWWSVDIAAESGFGGGVTVARFAVSDRQDRVHFSMGSPGDFEAFTSDAACKAALLRHEHFIRRGAPWIIDFTVSRSGWPFPCMACEHSLTAADSRLMSVLTSKALGDATAEPPQDLKEWSFTLPMRGHMLPLRPLPVAFALCSGTYAVAWLLLLLIARDLPTRSRRGHCAKCRYDLSGLPAGAPCPECGTSRA